MIYCDFSPFPFPLAFGAFIFVVALDTQLLINILMYFGKKLKKKLLCPSKETRNTYALVGWGIW